MWWNYLWEKGDSFKNVFLLKFLCRYDLGTTQQMCYFSEKMLLYELWSKWIIHIDITERGLPMVKRDCKSILKEATIPSTSLELQEPSSDWLVFLLPQFPQDFKVISTVEGLNRELDTCLMSFWPGMVPENLGPSFALIFPIMPQKWKEARQS